MQLTYDPAHNVAYLRLRDSAVDVETLRLSDEVNVDITSDGAIVGIELLNANDQIAASDGGKLIVRDMAGAIAASVPLVAAE